MVGSLTPLAAAASAVRPLVSPPVVVICVFSLLMRQAYWRMINDTDIFPKKLALCFVDFFSVVFLFSISLVFTLIFTISFLLQSLDIFNSSFFSFLSWRLNY